jgi:predicted transcriptional regulator
MVRAGTLAREDAPTCSLNEGMGEVKKRVEDAGWDTCVVVNEQRIVFGLLRAKHLGSDPNQKAEQAMSPGPSTFRPHVSAVELGEYMVEHDLPTVPITTGEGVLIGVLRREDAARVALEHHQHHVQEEQEEQEEHEEHEEHDHDG